MAEITEREVEWAAVRRMQQMLRAPHPDFEETHTYSIFNSILCWTLQRVRAVPVYPGGPADRPQRQEAARARDPLFDAADGLQEHFLQTMVAEVFPNLLAGHEVGGFLLNELPNRDEDGNGISCLALLIALRNATAHGDGRKVKPINSYNRLIGFELALTSPSRFPTWAVDVRLDRQGMCMIADTLAELFCNALIDPDDRESIVHARNLREVT